MTDYSKSNTPPFRSSLGNNSRVNRGENSEKQASKGQASAEPSKTEKQPEPTQVRPEVDLLSSMKLAWIAKGAPEISPQSLHIAGLMTEIPFTPEQHEADYRKYSAAFARELGLSPDSPVVADLVDEYLINKYAGVPVIKA